MKKSIMVALALLVVGATFNSVEAQQIPPTRVDSLSYSMGMAQTQGLKDYLAKQMKIDVNLTDDFVKGLKKVLMLTRTNRRLPIMLVFRLVSRLSAR